jgi:branched-chain amino acid transport system permease protein
MRGSVIATVILYALPEMFRGLGDYRMLIYAIVLIAMMIFNNAPYFVQLREKIAALPVFDRFRKKPKVSGGEAK